MEKPSLGGRGLIRAISLNGLDVLSHKALSSVGRHICNTLDLQRVRQHFFPGAFVFKGRPSLSPRHALSSPGFGGKPTYREKSPTR